MRERERYRQMIRLIRPISANGRLDSAWHTENRI